MKLGPFSPVGVALGLSIGILAGIGGFTFLYARGAAYLTNDPKACANCHVMQTQYDGWTKSSHRSVATCNDCHAPHNLAGKLAIKMENGFRHSVAFTTGRFHEPIQITKRDRRVAEESCRHCHRELVETMDHSGKGGVEVSCTRCHRSVGHLE
jgi:cytochrome c nitrite reductase small subunit